MKPGYHAGVFYQRPISDKVMVVPALIYTTRGGQDETRETMEITNTATLIQKEKVVLTTHYLEVPIALKYYFDPKLHISISPMISFLLDHTAKITSTGCINESCTGVREEDNEYADFRDIELGLGFGFGYYINRHVSMATQYQLGMSSIVEESEVFNRVLSFSLGYEF
ncbi:hypothetical protein OKW21_003076 [Catalinimonas alkaloidigena]|nr:hypothetical protein [Catalinimonas alkaloidigena]